MQTIIFLQRIYDGNGNVPASGGKTFAYDSENRLVSMSSGAVSVVYVDPHKSLRSLSMVQHSGPIHTGCSASMKIM